MPHRQRLTQVIGQLTALPWGTRLALIPLYQRMIDCLSAHETLQHLVIKLHIAAADWSRAEAAAGEMTRLAHCFSRQPHLLTEVCRQVAHKLRDSKGHWQPEMLLDMVDALDNEGGSEALSIGLSVLAAAGEALAWNADCANRLRAYRAHENLAVRSLALDIWTAAE